MANVQKKILGISLFLLILCNISFGIEIDSKDRVYNSGGYCTWASLETLANANNINNLKGILVERKKDTNNAVLDGGHDWLIKKELDEHKVKYEMRNQWSFDRTLLEKYVDSHGVAVALKQGNPHSIGCHMIVITKYDANANGGKVEFYDSSKPINSKREPKIWVCGRDFFDYWWLGSSVVILEDLE